MTPQQRERLDFLLQLHREQIKFTFIQQECAKVQTNEQMKNYYLDCALKSEAEELKIRDQINDLFYAKV